MLYVLFIILYCIVFLICFIAAPSDLDLDRFLVWCVKCDACCTNYYSFCGIFSLCIDLCNTIAHPFHGNVYSCNRCCRDVTTSDQTNKQPAAAISIDVPVCQDCRGHPFHVKWHIYSFQKRRERKKHNVGHSYTLQTLTGISYSGCTKRMFEPSRDHRKLIAFWFIIRSLCWLVFCCFYLVSCI